MEKRLCADIYGRCRYSGRGRDGCHLHIRQQSYARGCRSYRKKQRRLCHRHHVGGYSSSQPSPHTSGEHLYDVLDLVIDNHSPIGDALLSHGEVAVNFSPSSTAIGSAILNAIFAEKLRKLFTGYLYIEYPKARMIPSILYILIAF